MFIEGYELILHEKRYWDVLLMDSIKVFKVTALATSKFQAESPEVAEESTFPFPCRVFFLNIMCA